MPSTSQTERLQRVANKGEGGRIDWIQPICMLALAIAGVVFIDSAQSYHESRLWLKQLFFIGLGAGVYVALARIDYKLLLENAHIFYALSILALLALWTPLGVIRYEARRWLDFGVMLFQPAEAAKIGALVLVASLLARSKVGAIRDSYVTLGKVFIVSMAPFVLIFWQPDLGSALVIPPMALSLLYASRLSERFFIMGIALFLGFSGLLANDICQYFNHYTEQGLSFREDRGAYESRSWLPLKDYQRERILTTVMPKAVDPEGIESSWNLNQSLIAVGAGGLKGKGVGQGTQALLGYLPRSVAHNDFIFSVIAEETGFLGGIAVIGVYMALLMNGFRIAGQARDRFGALLAIGATVIFAAHVFINIGMTIGLMPITGLPLPLLSYGGSFLLSCCAMQGLIQSVHMHRREFA